MAIGRKLLVALKIVEVKIREIREDFALQDYVKAQSAW